VRGRLATSHHEHSPDTFVGRVTTPIGATVTSSVIASTPEPVPYEAPAIIEEGPIEDTPLRSESVGPGPALPDHAGR